eukprot:GGOE01045860.1.p2 GENE.GGOE01045860.1~~GGOE01045860.1.p2  ORF type:complete len:113 (-),score=11.87 GGOE01045860.1:117-455(-)
MVLQKSAPSVMCWTHSHLLPPSSMTIPDLFPPPLHTTPQPVSPTSFSPRPWCDLSFVPGTGRACVHDSSPPPLSLPSPLFLLVLLSLTPLASTTLPISQPSTLAYTVVQEAH